MWRRLWRRKLLLWLGSSWLVRIAAGKDNACGARTQIFPAAFLCRMAGCPAGLFRKAGGAAALPHFRLPAIEAGYRFFCKKEVIRKKNRIFARQCGRKQANKLSPSDTIIAANFTEIAGKKNINEIPLYKKRDFLRKLVASNADLFNQSEELQKLFPLLPKNQEEYCSLLPAIVKSLGIETNSLSSEQVKIFDSSMSDLSSALKNISDSSFKNLSISHNV